MIKKSILIILLIIGFNISPLDAQCFDLVKTKGFIELDTTNYVPEGRFDALQLSEGDYLNVYKSFFRGKTYRIVVVGDEILPDLKFKIKDLSGNIIYENTEENKLNWDYTSDKNQNLMISLEIPVATGSMPKSGCVAVILGYKIN